MGLGTSMPASSRLARCCRLGASFAGKSGAAAAPRLRLPPPLDVPLDVRGVGVSSKSAVTSGEEPAAGVPTSTLCGAQGSEEEDAAPAREGDAGPLPRLSCCWKRSCCCCSWGGSAPRHWAISEKADEARPVNACASAAGAEEREREEQTGQERAMAHESGDAESGAQRAEGRRHTREEEEVVGVVVVEEG